MISDDPRASFDLLDRLVMMDTSEGNYRHAAAVYFNILPYTTDVDQRRRFFLAGLHVLRSGNLLNEAIQAGESYAGPLAEDPQTLTYRVNLALANGRTDVAASLALLVRTVTSGLCQGCRHGT
jgi:alkyl sulfatase BDS1-like metallo-beta-lactamase superfamily hydrolase